MANKNTRNKKNNNTTTTTAASSSDVTKNTIIKLPQLVMTGILDAERLANEAARELGPRWNGRAGIVVEAQPRGYLVYQAKTLSEFEELIAEPQIRHWA